MTITAEQTAAISAELSVDLATITDNRLIELCLLYRSAPEALPTFPDLLEVEITRRFTAAEIAANDVMFSVIQNFANQFTSGVPFFAKKMLEMSASVNRDIWFSNNSNMFAQAIEDDTLLEWLVTQPDVVTKILNNTLGLTAIAKSYKASSAILSNAETVAILKGATNVWQIVTVQSQFMDVLLLSNDLMTYVANNSTAITAVIETSTAMSAVAASSVALSVIVKSTSARDALTGSNTILQDTRVAIYNTVKASWTKHAGIYDNNATNFNGGIMATLNTAVANPAGFVFASLGWNAGYSRGKSCITHPNGTFAAEAATTASPKTLANLDAVSFNGAIFKATGTGNVSAQAYAELWIPPAI